MKFVHRLLLLLAFSAALYSCQKEYSLENNNNTVTSDAQWSFKENSVSFSGPVDTGTIDTSGGYKILTVSGHSADHKDLFSIGVFSSNITAGTYKTPYAQFTYTRNGVLLYRANPTLVDSFTVIITKIDSNGVIGTFYGKALDSAKNSKTIVDGKFSAHFKSSVTPTPAGTDSGSVVFWSKTGCGSANSPIDVKLGTKAGQITVFSATAPATCDPAGYFFAKLPVGTYPWVAKCGTDSITGNVVVQNNSCTKLQVDFTLPSLDYFPTTTSSNWSYAYEGGAPGDTVFTVSTGISKTFSSQSYKRFIDYNTGGPLDTTYYRKDSLAGIYYEYLPAYLDSTNSGFDKPIEYKFLVDNIPAGSVFNSGPFSIKVQGLPASGSISGTILEKAVSATVAGKPYSDVIKVRLSVNAVILGQTTEAYRLEAWYARGVGLIKYLYYYKAPFTTPTDVLDITGRYKVY